MHRPELCSLENHLLNGTVLADFMSPLLATFENLRYNEKIFRTLSMPLFSVLGCLRHLQGCSGLRQHIQSLFHLIDDAKVPLARSTAADALSSKKRQKILEASLEQLYKTAQEALPDRLSEIPGLKDRPVYAVDGTYQKESSHYKKVTPKNGGDDNPKGHCLLPFFDVRRGIPITACTDTSNVHEITLLREYVLAPNSLFNTRNALWVVDRGYVATQFWDGIKQKSKSEVVMRLKENMPVTTEEDRTITEQDVNVGVLSDKNVTLNASKKAWRLVTYQTHEGHVYTYLTNNFDLEPGVIAFLYLRRWDEEKCFDPWKNDFSQKKAWSKNKTAIQNQTTMAIMTSILVALFENKHLEEWAIQDEKALKKKDIVIDKLKKIDGAKKEGEIEKYRWFHRVFKKVSKTSKQIFRFIKGCYSKKASKALYDNQLRVLFIKYL